MGTNNSLAVVAKSENLFKALEQFKTEGANLLLPSTRIEGLSEWHEPVIDQVQLNPDTDGGDIYIQEKGNQHKDTKYAISKQGLMKLSACAGIMWHPTESRRTDDRRDKNYVSFQAVGGVRKADGTPIFVKSEYDLDFEVIEDELEEQYEKKAAGYEKDSDTKWWHKMDRAEKDAYINKCIRRDLLQKRKHKMKLAESGAMTRVIRALLGLKSTYKKKELEKPFVMARIVIKPDFTDKDVRQQMIAASIKSITSVYGESPDYPRLDLPHEGPIYEIPPEEVDESIPAEIIEDEARGPEGMDHEGADFKMSEKNVQIELLKKLSEIKAYNLENLKYPLDDPRFEEHLLKFYLKLKDMPDSEIPY